MWFIFKLVVLLTILYIVAKMNIFEWHKSLSGGERAFINTVLVILTICIIILVIYFVVYVVSGRQVTIKGTTINEPIEKKDTIKQVPITEKGSHSTDKSYIRIPKNESMKNVNYGVNNGHIGDVNITTPPPQLTPAIKQQILNKLEELGLQLPQEKRKSIFLVTANGKPSQTVSDEIRTFIESKGYKIDGTGTGAESDHTSIGISLNHEFQCINVSIHI